MRKRNGPPKRFVMCIDNSDYLASLELNKIYAVLPDPRAAEDDFLRVIDESGEDYLYSAERFVPVELPRQAQQSVMRTVRETPKLANKTLQPTSRAGRKAKPKRNSRAVRG